MAASRTNVLKDIRPVRCKVKFKYPGGGIKLGQVIKATPTRFTKGLTGEGGDYATRVELIRFDDGDECVRFAYWRKPMGKDYWNFASQTTWVFSVEVTIQAIEDAREAGLLS